MIEAGGATRLIANRSPWASLIEPAMMLPMNPPIKKMNTGNRAKAWARIR